MRLRNGSVLVHSEHSLRPWARKGMLRLFVQRGSIALAILLVSRGAAAAPTPPTAYVALDGTGDFNCDGASDNVQIQQALDYAATHAGITTIFLKPGTYHIAQPMVFKSGNITLTAAPGTKLRLDSNVPWPPYSSDASVSAMFSGENLQNITIQGFEVDGNRDNQGGKPHGKGYHNLFQFKHVSNIELYDMHLHHSLGDGLVVRYGYGSTAAGVSFHDNQVEYLGHDVVYLLYLRGAEVYGNRVKTTSNSACRTTQSEDVEIHHNDYEGTSPYSSTGPLIEIQGSDSSGINNIVIHDNYLHDSKGAGIWAFDSKSSSKLQVHHNVFDNTGNYKSDSGYSSSGVLLEGMSADLSHNVFFNCQKSAVRLSDHHDYGLSSGYAIDLRNNIIVGTRAYANGAGAAVWNEVPGIYKVTGGYNCLFDNAGGATQGSGISFSQTLSADPLFADTGQGDFHLRSQYGRYKNGTWVKDSETSPCIDAADPASAFSFEPAPNGGRANVGRYGKTDEASKSEGVAPEPDAAAPESDATALEPEAATPEPDAQTSNTVDAEAGEENSPDALASTMDGAGSGPKDASSGAAAEVGKGSDSAWGDARAEAAAGAKTRGSEDPQSWRGEQPGCSCSTPTRSSGAGWVALLCGVAFLPRRLRRRSKSD